MKFLKAFENFSVQELEKMDLTEREIENKSGEIKDIFTDLESEIDIKVDLKFEKNNKFLNHLYITLTESPETEEISDQIHKIREIGKAISRLENCMQFYKGNAEYYDDEYGDIHNFSFDLNFLIDYSEDSTIRDPESPDYHDSPVGIISKLEILFHYV